MPTSNASTLRQRDVDHILHPYSNPNAIAESGPLIIDRGDGVYVYDITLTIPDFQVFAAEAGDNQLKVGGQTRGSCEEGGKGLLLKVTTDLSSSTLLKDDDPFPSSIQSVASTGDDTYFTLKRQRPIGVRRLGAASPEVATKRWGDGGNELLEFSLLELSANGSAISLLYDSAFGLSAFAQGLVLNRGKPVIYGSLGGRPAISAKP